MSKKYGHTEPVSRIKERYPLGQLKENLAAVNALLKRTNALREKLGYAISKFDMVFAFQKGRSILELDRTRKEELE